MPEDIYTGRYTIRYSETGADGKIKIGAIFNYLQDAAGEHAALLGVSGGDLLPLNLGWVLYHYQFDVTRYPTWREEILVRTWKFPYRRLYELREFEVEDKSGAIIARAKSSWILINLASRKPMRLDRNLPSSVNHAKEISFTFNKLSQIEQVDTERPVTVTTHDLDFNKHANNTCFIQWALDTVSPEMEHGMDPRSVEATFLGEARLGETLLSQAQIVDGSTNTISVHRIGNRESGKELMRLAAVWGRRQ